MTEVPLAREFADRMDEAGIGPGDPAFAHVRAQNAEAYRRAGVAACALCPHLSLEHPPNSKGVRGRCAHIDGVTGRCGCGGFEEVER